MGTNTREYEHLPLHPVPARARRREEGEQAGALRISGLVAHRRRLRAGALRTLARTELVETFGCEEGWTVPNQRWGGVRLADVLALAQPLAHARYVRVRAGQYAIPLALGDAGTALLCDELNGEPLGLEHGGPWRLVVPGGHNHCFSRSVRWQAPSG
jgi:DMSO/TMAO reductase YedYZ molybdopterin-dependent catalytic subunit